MAPKKKPRPKKRPASKKAAAHVAHVRKLRKAAEAGARARVLDEGGPLADFAAAVRQLPLPHIPRPLGTHTPAELEASTVQTIRVGRMRADRWQAAAAGERRAWAVWASIQLDAAADRAGIPALPPGAR